MISKEEVILFFDKLAPGWDAGMVRNEEVICRILNNACVFQGKSVLDVACGTGVMIPYYLGRGVQDVVAVDISPEMVRIARDKFSGRKEVTVLCEDAETAVYGKTFDCIVIYNAFPHFKDPDLLIGHLSSLLSKGGVLTVAHGMSRERINAHHFGTSQRVSNGLMPAEDLAAIFEKYLQVETVVSDEKMYQVTGVRRL